jgi:hypothetical protein
MLYKSTDKKSENLLYPQLKELWDELPTHRAREILVLLDIDRVHLWRLLNKKVGDTPMRRPYLIVLENELLKNDTIEENS